MSSSLFAGRRNQNEKQANKNNNKNENQTHFCSVEARDSYSNVFKIKLDTNPKSSTATCFR